MQGCNIVQLILVIENGNYTNPVTVTELQFKKRKLQLQLDWHSVECISLQRPLISQNCDCQANSG